jgi:hypothetical protein
MQRREISSIESLRERIKSVDQSISESLSCSIPIVSVFRSDLKLAHMMVLRINLVRDDMPTRNCKSQLSIRYHAVLRKRVSQKVPLETLGLNLLRNISAFLRRASRPCHRA